MSIKLDSTVCRVCLNSNGNIPLFDGCGKDDQYRFCTLLEPCYQDGLPAFLCYKCNDRLKIAYDFRFQAVYTENYLKSIIFFPALNSKPKNSENVNYIKKTCKEVIHKDELSENMTEIHTLLNMESEIDKLDMDFLNNGNCVKNLILNETIANKFQTDFNCGSNKLSCNNIFSNNNLKSYTDEQCHKLEEQCCDNISDNSSIKLNSIDQIKASNSSLTEKNCCRDENNAEKSQKIIKNLKTFLKKTKRFKFKHTKIRKCINSSNIQCNICGSVFTHSTSLKSHMLVHSGERPFKCNECEKSFTRKTVLNIHRRLHTGEKPYKCTLCPKEYVTREALTRHMTKDHEEVVGKNFHRNKLSYICEICHKGLCSKYSLQSHMNLHRQKDSNSKFGKVATSLECHVCNKIFTCKYTLQRHINDKHQEPPNITCNICNEAFTTKWEHSKHLHSHDLNKKFQCDICQKTFYKKFQLLYHLQTHKNKNVA